MTFQLNLISEETKSYLHHEHQICDTLNKQLTCLQVVYENRTFIHDFIHDEPRGHCGTEYLATLYSTDYSASFSEETRKLCLAFSLFNKANFYRLVASLDGFVCAINNRNTISAALCARGIHEQVASIFCAAEGLYDKDGSGYDPYEQAILLWRRISRDGKKDRSQLSTDNKLLNKAFERLDWIIRKQAKKNGIRLIEKDGPDFFCAKYLYDFLCDYIHPNYKSYSALWCGAVPSLDYLTKENDGYDPNIDDSGIWVGLGAMTCWDDNPTLMMLAAMVIYLNTYFLSTDRLELFCVMYLNINAIPAEQRPRMMEELQSWADGETAQPLSSGLLNTIRDKDIVLDALNEAITVFPFRGDLPELSTKEFERIGTMILKSKNQEYVKPD